ncbi:MAG: tetratricopeptide repeat protein, partial [Nitrosospira sp.]|nr:tetratricopeptide repeat protein [Nitrosospira sp.]
PSDAERVLKEALASARSRRAGRSEAQILYNLGVLYSDGGETEKARESWERALQIHIERGETEKASRLRAIIDGLPHGSPRAPE